MTKTKKQRNHVLIRRVKRTSAAILLVMAVVVAAIPVENLGTVQAEDTDTTFDMGTIYSEDTSGDSSVAKGVYTSSVLQASSGDYNYEKNFTGESTTIKVVQQVSGSSTLNIEDVYKVTLSSQTTSPMEAVVSGIGTMTDITVNSEEFYGLVMFRVSNENINVSIDSLQVTFASGNETTSDSSAGTVSVDIGSNGYYQVNGTGTTYQASAINSGTLNKVSSTTYTGSNTVTLNSTIQDNCSYTDDSNGYNNLYGGSGTPKTQTVTHKTLIDGAEETALKAKQAAIDSYNSDLTTLAEIATKLSSGTDASPATLTQTEVDLWTKYASNYSNLETAAKTLSISKSNFVDEDGNGLADVYDYIICNYYGVSAQNNLKDYALVAATYKATGESSSETVYVAKLTGQNAQIGQYLYEADGSKYLATGKAKIVGVLSEAFKGDTTLTSILLPSSIKYIGAEAFNECSVLSSVTLNATSCVLIGDSAFKNSGLTSFTISAGAALKSIGVCAFENTKLTSITIPASVTELCNCSFMGISTLKSVEFSSRTSNITIGKYAFYNCNALTSVEFGTNSQTYYIQKGAFAVDHDHVDAAMDFSFPSSNYKIDYSGDDGDNKTTSSTDYDYILAGRRNLGTVTFTLTSGTVPTNTLRGCYNLKCAVFIDNAANAGYTTYEDNAVTTSQLFSDVTNDEFYVKGPATKANSTTVAQPRSDSWTGILGYTLSNGSYAPVPYMYEINGKTYIDLGYNFSGDLYVATVEVLDESAKTAELSSYQVNTAHGNPSGYRISIEIPDEVGGYKIVSIGDNCFTDTIKGIVYEIIIPDGGYITTIGDSAFEGCDYLERVYIGSSVAEIGDEAFANCPMLENVEFGFDVSDWWNLDDDDDAWTELTIGDNAFNTQSEYLTFHGAINADYAPYALAMSSSSDDMTTTGAHICYKTDAPLNLTVLRNESTGEATLVDYPHYDEIDDINKDYIEEEYAEEGTTEACTYSITEGFEDVLEGSTELSAYPDAELDMVEAALYLNLPSGIKSVDSKLLFEGSGSSRANDSDDKFYVNYTYEYNSTNAEKTTKSEFKNNPVYEQKYWTTDERSESRLISYTYAVDGSDSTNGHYDSSYASAYGDTDVSIGGLFSGYFDEDGVKKSLESVGGSESFKGFLDDTTSYNGHTYVSESYDSGNDYLTSVDMPTVTALPDYAFDSCENLLTAAFTDAMESMGALPFRDCKEMYSIDLGTTTTDSTGDTISTNGYFAFKNLILYAVDDDGSYEITEVLEGRGSSGSEYLGSGITKSDIIDGGSNVTSIAKGAFSNNENLTTVDLSNTEVVEIPEDCFENDTKLYQIILPDTTRTVDAYAFDTGSDVTVYIPNNLCTLSTEAKTDGETLTICGEKLLDDGSVSPLYYSYEKMQTVYGEDNVVWSETESECVVTFLNKDLTVLQTITVDKGGSLSYIPTAQKVSGYDFECWLYIVSSTEVLSGTVYTDDIFTDITENRTYYPSYTANPSSVESDGNSYVFQFENCAAYVDGKAITSGTTLTGGTTVTLLADADTFSYWSVSSGDSTDYTGNLEYGISQYLNTFTMPNASVKVTANLATSSGSSGSSSSDDDDDDDDDDEDTYTLTVNYGSGSGEYEAGEKVTIAAYAPESSTKVFSKWTTTNSDVGFASATAATTTIVMPSEDVTVTANYKTRTSDDDDDDDDDDSSSSSGRTSVASTTTATNGTNGSGTSTTTTSTSTTTSTESGSADDGNKIYITKNGISNKDVASITVEGSTDNFIVRISESDEATEAAKLALTNEYGSLDNLVYFPMDISLYDATGQNKITDSYGLNITVTMPIPDVLIQYGGNARVAACDDGVLTQITPKFTTIDGIACISFTPPHFSPYVIYVDTSNLTAGTLDSTPKTGDPIHPKWFLAIGLGCASVVLFATSDGRRRRKFRTV